MAIVTRTSQGILQNQIADQEAGRVGDLLKLRDADGSELQQDVVDLDGRPELANVY